MAFNKVAKFGESENILDSEVGLVTKTAIARQSMASSVDGRLVIKAGALYDDTADTYEEVESPANDANPKAEGWYTKSGSTYTASSATSLANNTTYYRKVTVASGMYGVVFEDYDMTDYDEYPISVVVAGRLKSAKCSSAAVSAKSTLKAQGLYLV